MSGHLANVLGALDGAEIPGGCDDCDAFQTITAVAGRAWLLLVHHDDECPTWRRMQKEIP